MYENNALNSEGKCISGKRMFDKIGAQTMANATYKMHHIECNIYVCNWCHYWHLTTVKNNKKNRFRHSKNIWRNNL